MILDLRISFIMMDFTISLRELSPTMFIFMVSELVQGPQSDVAKKEASDEDDSGKVTGYLIERCTRIDSHRGEEAFW